jgi:hypothetical protein
MYPLENVSPTKWRRPSLMSIVITFGNHEGALLLPTANSSCTTSNQEAQANMQNDSKKRIYLCVSPKVYDTLEEKTLQSELESTFPGSHVINEHFLKGASDLSEFFETIASCDAILYATIGDSFLTTSQICTYRMGKALGKRQGMIKDRVIYWNTILVIIPPKDHAHAA